MADTGKGLLSSSDDDDEDPAALEAAQRLMESTPTIQQARPAQVDGAAQPGQQNRPTETTQMDEGTSMMLRVIITYVERHNELNSVKQPVTIPKPLLTHFYEFKDKKLQKQEMLNAIAKHFEDNVESVALTYDTILKKLQTKVHQARNAPLQMQGRETCAAMPEHQPPVPAAGAIAPRVASNSATPQAALKISPQFGHPPSALPVQPTGGVNINRPVPPRPPVPPAVSGGGPSGPKATAQREELNLAPVKAAAAARLVTQPAPPPNIAIHPIPIIQNWIRNFAREDKLEAPQLADDALAAIAQSVAGRVERILADAVAISEWRNRRQVSALISLQATGAATRGLAAPKLRLSVRSEPLKEIERINTRERLSEEAHKRMRDEAAAATALDDKSKKRKEGETEEEAKARWAKAAKQLETRGQEQQFANQNKTALEQIGAKNSELDFMYKLQQMEAAGGAGASQDGPSGAAAGAGGTGAPGAAAGGAALGAKADPAAEKAERLKRLQDSASVVTPVGAKDIQEALKRENRLSLWTLVKVQDKIFSASEGPQTAPLQGGQQGLSQPSRPGAPAAGPNVAAHPAAQQQARLLAGGQQPQQSRSQPATAPMPSGGAATVQVPQQVPQQ